MEQSQAGVSLGPRNCHRLCPGKPQQQDVYRLLRRLVVLECSSSMQIFKSRSNEASSVTRGFVILLCSSAFSSFIRVQNCSTLATSVFTCCSLASSRRAAAALASFRQCRSARLETPPLQVRTSSTAVSLRSRIRHSSSPRRHSTQCRPAAFPQSHTCSAHVIIYFVLN